jgi:hypothetical protein
MRSPPGSVPGSLLFLLFLLSSTSAAFAQVTRLELERIESPALDGRSFGEAGLYERLRGTAHGEVDPADARNAIVVNLDGASRNARGRVEYRTTVEVYRPVDPDRWNGAIYHTVPNRGGPVVPDPALLAMGFAFVQVGWQGDLEQTDRNVVAALPVAVGRDGSPVVGLAMEEFIFGDGAEESVGRLTYPPAPGAQDGARLTVRRTQHGTRETPADLAWRFEGVDRVVIRRPPGFDGGAIYELVYPARDPIVLGLGFAAVRDVISLLRYDAADPSGGPNPLGAPARHAISLGISQSGRFLRDMLYLGFNEDLSGRIVFDGMHPDIAGSRKTFTNHAFGQPGRWQRQHEDHLYPGDQFPFTYATLFDPISGRTDGLMERCALSATCPKIVHTDGEAELWQARASLVVTDTEGRDIPLPSNVRVYLIAGTQHGGGPGLFATEPAPGICVNLQNPMSLTEVRRALTVALYRWVADGTDPPDSRFPAVATGGLIPPDRVAYPAALGYAGSYNGLRLHDHATLPPRTGPAYPVLLPRVDRDGNMVDGIRHPYLAAPVGTHTGWNMRRESFGPGGQCAGAGTFASFARTAAERESSGDTRLSLEERYPDAGAYVAAVSAAADRLVGEGLLLPEDAASIVERARSSGAAGGR